MIELFVVRVGEWGGTCWWTATIRWPFHKFCSTLPAFEMEARPVIPVEDAVRVELEAIAWRDGLKRRLTSEKITLKPLPSASSDWRCQRCRSTLVPIL